MKPLIVGLAITILFTMFFVYQQDYNMYLRQLENLKYIADEAAASGVLYYDIEEYSEGKLIYTKSSSINRIDYIIKYLLKLDENLNPASNSYWESKIEYNVYYFDDSKICSIYKNGVLESETIFDYPYMFIDTQANYNKLITEPTVIVTINAGKPLFRLSFINPNNAIRSSGYEYKER